MQLRYSLQRCQRHEGHGSSDASCHLVERSDIRTNDETRNFIKQPLCLARCDAGAAAAAAARHDNAVVRQPVTTVGR